MESLMDVSVVDYPNASGSSIKGHEFVSLAPQRLKSTIIEIIQKNHKIVDKGDFTLYIGGDHCISVNSIYKERPTHVIWLDAHADYNTPETSPTGHTHGMVLSALCGKIPTMNYKCIDVENILWYNTRDTDILESKMMYEDNAKVVTDPEYLYRWVQNLDVDARVHVSLDIDLFDPIIAPASGTPVAKGASKMEGMELIDILRKSGLVTSLDIVEYNPFFDVCNKTEKLIFECLTEFMRNE
jgi:arginase